MPLRRARGDRKIPLPERLAPSLGRPGESSPGSVVPVAATYRQETGVHSPPVPAGKTPRARPEPLRYPIRFLVAAQPAPACRAPRGGQQVDRTVRLRSLARHQVAVRRASRQTVHPCRSCDPRSFPLPSFTKLYRLRPSSCVPALPAPVSVSGFPDAPRSLLTVRGSQRLMRGFSGKRGRGRGFAFALAAPAPARAHL